MARSRRSPGTSAAPADRAPAGGGRGRRVEALLAGESLDTSRLAYDFDVDHVALIAAGPTAVSAIEERLVAAGSPQLLIEVGEGLAWGWLAMRGGFDQATLDTVASPGGVGSASAQAGGLRLGVGEPERGLGGWRLSHHQARAALAVALRSDDLVVRYGDVALLASLVRDDLLAASLQRLYLEPLDGERDGGEELRRTLRAYFDADRNVSEAGAAIGVTRQAVARRLHRAEERLGRPIAGCAAELELALCFERLEPTPLFAP